MKPGDLHHAFTLPELMVSMGLGVAMLAGLLIGSTTLQRGYIAAQYQLDCQQDQVRTLDYITRDLRRATAVTISNQGRQLSVNIPDQLDPAALATPDPRAALRMPVIDKGLVRYGATPSLVSYYISGTAFIRSENGVESVISTNRFGVEGFLVAANTVAGPAQVSVQLGFVPRFSANARPAQQAATQLTAAVRLRNGAQVTLQ